MTKEDIDHNALMLGSFTDTALLTELRRRSSERCKFLCSRCGKPLKEKCGHEKVIGLKEGFVQAIRPGEEKKDESRDSARST